MMKALLAVRLRAMLAGFTRQSRQKNKKSKGMLVLFALLYLYLAVVIVGVMCLMFSSLAEPYHALGLDWLYFAMAGLMALGFAVFGSVFTTQNQLYDSKDNDMLLSMPVKPKQILLSRMIPLLLLNGLFAGLVMLPAAVMYAVLIRFSLSDFLIQILGVLAVIILAQAIACLLGYLLHLLLSRMNKSLASMLYMVVFLGLYFYIYSQAGNIINSMSVEGTAIASALEAWVWPVCALGRGCSGEYAYFLVFAAICAVAFGLVYCLLSHTFLKAATSRRSSCRRKLDMAAQKAGNSSSAIVFKEWRHFLGSPVYLTNMGIGIIMTAALAVAGVILRGKLLEMLEEFSAMGMDLTGYAPLIICGMLAFLSSMMFVSAPSVSLEGKNLWVLKSMPVSARLILRAKLKFHFLLTTPVTAAAGLVLAVAYGCRPVDTLLCALVPGLLTVVCGVVGMSCGLNWAKLDWLNEAYPCKQGAAVGITMFAMMGIPVALGVLFFLLADLVTPTGFLCLCVLLLGAMSVGFYRLVVTWGVRKWDSL